MGSESDTFSEEPSAESRQTGNRRLEVLAAVLLGLTTVAIAWGAYQANVWGGLQDEALTESARLTTAAASEYEAAGSLISFDQTLFIEVVLQLNSPDADQTAGIDTVDFLLRNMTEEGEAAVIDWFENDLDLPFTDAYYDSFYEPADDLLSESEAKFEEGSTNNTNGDKYVLASTILASVLFFAGISTVLQTHRVRSALLVGGGALWIGAVSYLATLPIASL
jgi:hypothetical protein